MKADFQEVIDQTRRVLRRKHMARKTEKSYLPWLKRFMNHYPESSANDWNREYVQDLLTYLAVDRRVSAPTQNQAFSDLLFLFREVRGGEALFFGITGRDNIWLCRGFGRLYPLGYGARQYLVVPRVWQVVPAGQVWPGWLQETIQIFALQATKLPVQVGVKDLPVLSLKVGHLLSLVQSLEQYPLAAPEDCKQNIPFLHPSVEAGVLQMAPKSLGPASGVAVQILEQVFEEFVVFWQCGSSLGQV